MTAASWVTVPCRTCGAGSGERCTGIVSGETLYGFVHVERVRAGLRVSASTTKEDR